MNQYRPWSASGSYYEVCNCEAICPCRRSDGGKGGRPTYDTCDFALSWWVKEGRAGAIDLDGLKVVMAGRWEKTNENPWRVILYVDETATSIQHDALAAIFLGRAGGYPAQSYALNIVEVHSIRPAHIELDHSANRQMIDVPPFLTVRTRESVLHDFTVTCGIPGHDHPGQEIIADVFRFKDAAFDWEFRGKCGFATDFSYRVT